MSDLEDLDVCNEALSMVRKADISDINEVGAGPEACKRHYMRVLRVMQKSFWWSFCRQYRDIEAQTAASKEPGYTYAHKKPIDCFRIDRVIPQQAPDNSQWLDHKFNPADYDTVNSLHTSENGISYPPTKWVEAGDYIHTNFSGIELTYYGLYTDMVRAPEHFRTAFVAQLAKAICLPATSDMKLAKETAENADAVLAGAKDVECFDLYTVEGEGSSFEDARNK
jgi:hypothetical protein